VDYGTGAVSGNSIPIEARKMLLPSRRVNACLETRVLRNRREAASRGAARSSA